MFCPLLLQRNSGKFKQIDVHWLKRHTMYINKALFHIGSARPNLRLNWTVPVK